MDKYACFEELSLKEPDSSFMICAQERSSGVAILAPHGGGIEPGTSEIAKAIAGAEHTFYSFEGRKQTGNRDLHITSINFDEPKGISIAKQSERLLAIHGCSERKAVVYLGGMDAALKAKVRHCLIEGDFHVEEHSVPELQGAYSNNICNRSKNNCGVQVEISGGLRKRMFKNVNKRKGRERTTLIFNNFVSAIRRAISKAGTSPDREAP